MDKCIYCNSQNIKTDIVVDQTADAGRIGLAYRTKFILGGVEEFYADLCLDCGSITRLYVKNSDRNWYVKKGK
jgi:hypothetical protein